ncbi:MAG: MBL fold metallo-hydrolase [Lachnospiraceae bacterium]|nr:MBL fold metallo-hydrolase [Lachnospiraceae bacterium]
MRHEITITVLIENTSDGVLACEHGLSLFIQFAGKRILLDAGSSDAFCKNADAMGISLTDLDAYILSHGHYDHSGGFEELFRRAPAAKVYARKEALDVYLSAAGGMHEISVPQNAASQRDRFLLVDGCREILPGVILVPHSTKGLAQIGEKSGLYKKQGDQIVPDDFSHEQSLAIDTSDGLVIFNSCSHAGAANIIREVRDACGQKRVYAYVGGLHMKGKKDGLEICTFSDAEIDSLCEVFQQEGIAQIYTGHCTGTPGFEKLRSRLGDRIHRLTTGLRFEL